MNNIVENELALVEWRPYVFCWNFSNQIFEIKSIVNVRMTGATEAKSAVRLSYLISVCWHQIKFYKLYAKWHVRSKHSTNYYNIHKTTHSIKTQAMVGLWGWKGGHMMADYRVQQRRSRHIVGSIIQNNNIQLIICVLSAKRTNEDDDCVWLWYRIFRTAAVAPSPAAEIAVSQSYLPPQTKKKEERASLILNQRWRRKGVMEMLKVLRRRMNVMNVKITQFPDGEWERVRSVTRLLDVV